MNVRTRGPGARIGSRGPGLVIDHLQRHDDAASLLPAVRRVLDLRQDVLALVPATLKEACEVTEGDDGIVLRVSSAGAAAKLRQTVPRLRRGLLERGWQVSSIRIRVQARAPEAPRQERRGEPMSDAGVDAFERLRGRLDDPLLRAAVERLVARRGR